LNLGLRIDRGFAMLASMYANAHTKTGGYKLWYFTPYEEEPPVSLDDAMKTWR